MHTPTYKECGMTLVELLIVMAILSLVLAGVYGLLDSAYQSYNHSRAKLESQQTARIVLDYLVYRLREIDGGRSTSDASDCLACHEANMDAAIADHTMIPCTQDVSIPQQAPAILDLKTVSLPSLPADIPAGMQQMDGNYIQFLADLLPLHGFNESFTDSPATGAPYNNGDWDWTAGNVTFDIDRDDRYDHGEPELLEDMNDNSRYDYFGETWTLQLRKANDGPYYELIESLSFDSLEPRTTKANGKILYDNSVYDATGYSNVAVAYGIVGLRIRRVPRYSTSAQYPTGQQVSPSCANSSNPTACHGSTASTGGTVDIYGNATNMDYTKFLASHGFWNTVGLSVEVITVDTRGFYQRFTRLRDFVNFRNIEVNK